MSEQFQNQIEKGKQKMPHCRNSSTVPTMWHYLFFYWTLKLFRQCGMLGFSIGHWNWSDSVALLVFLWDFGGTVPKSNRKTNNILLSEEFQSPTEKQIMPHCRNSIKVQ
jgi:hypothetical protein